MEHSALSNTSHMSDAHVMQAAYLGQSICDTELHGRQALLDGIKALKSTNGSGLAYVSLRAESQTM